MKKLAEHLNPVRVFLVFLFAFGCVTAVLVAFAIGAAVAHQSESSSTPAQFKAAAGRHQLAQLHHGQPAGFSVRAFQA